MCLARPRLQRLWCFLPRGPSTRLTGRPWSYDLREGVLLPVQGRREVEVWTSPGGSGLTPSGRSLPPSGYRGSTRPLALGLVSGGCILGFGGVALQAQGSLPADCCPRPSPVPILGLTSGHPAGLLQFVQAGYRQTGRCMPMRSRGGVLWNWDTAWGAQTARTCWGGVGGACAHRKRHQQAPCALAEPRPLSHRTQGPQHHGTNCLCPPGVRQSGIWGEAHTVFPSLAFTCPVSSHLAATMCLCPCGSAPDPLGAHRGRDAQVG